MVNDLAQKASCFRSNREKLYVLEKLDVLVCNFGCSDLYPMYNAKICSVEPSSAKPDVPELETGWSGISRGSDDLGETATAEPVDWRTPLIYYLENSSHVIDTKVRRQALKYILLDCDLHRRTIDDLLLRCLGSDQSNIDMGEFLMKYALHISQLI
jgi:hypothetical protein